MLNSFQHLLHKLQLIATKIYLAAGPEIISVNQGGHNR